MKNACPNCFGACKDKQFTSCDSCQADVHVSCIGLASADDVRITRTKSRNIKIVCNICSTNMSNYSKLEQLISSIRDDFANKFEALNEKFKSLNTQSFDKPISPENFEEVVAEANERMIRSRNVIIAGITEENGSHTDRIEKDKNTVSKILNTVFDNNDHESPLKITRIGNTSNSKPRLVKVTFHDNLTAKLFLKNKNRLLGTPYEKFKVKDDKTPIQVKYLNDLRDKLNERLSAGELGLTIKYEKGIPVIIQGGTKNRAPRAVSTGHLSTQI